MYLYTMYIMGNSWGSVIAIKAVQQYPKLYYAYIGIGQIVKMGRGKKISYHTKG